MDICIADQVPNLRTEISRYKIPQALKLISIVIGCIILVSCGVTPSATIYGKA